MKYLLLTVLLALAVSCGPDGQHVRVEGEIEGINQTNLFAYFEETPSGGTARVDTIAVQRGTFKYECELAQPSILTLLYPNYATTSLVVEPGRTIKVKGNATRLSEIEVAGNDDNKLLTEFRLRSAGKRDNEMQREAATFIRSHPQSLAATLVFRDVFANARVVQHEPTASLLSELRKAQPDEPVLQSIADRVSPLLKTAPGQLLPAFRTTGMDGKVITEADFKGKNVFVIFSAQWLPQSYAVRREAEQLTKETGDRLSIFYVSLDVDRATLERSARYESLPGRIVYDGLATHSPLLHTFGVRHLPANILFGKDGKVLDRDIPSDQWSDNITKLL